MTSISSWLRSQPLEEMVQHYIWRIRSKTSSYTLCNRWSANSGRVEGLRDRVLGESWGINVLWCKGSGSKRYWLRRRFVLLVSLYGWYVVMLCNIIILIYIYIFNVCLCVFACFNNIQDEQTSHQSLCFDGLKRCDEPHDLANCPHFPKDGRDWNNTEFWPYASGVWT